MFILECDYEERLIAKDAGFRWHAGDRCRTRGCSGCAAGLGRAWWTRDLARAAALVEYADSDLADSLRERAGPAIEAAEAEAREAKRREQRKKLERAMASRASRARDAEVEAPAPDGLSYLPYQRAAIAYALGRPATLIADEMGLGKTVEAIGVVNALPNAERVLVVCPASLKVNWQRECERWLARPMSVGVAAKKYPHEADVVVINYDILGKWESELLATRWDVLIADECHFVKNREAKRSKRLYAIEAERLLFLTGTPILNRPSELFAIASHLDPDEFGHFWTFAKKYCNPIRTNFGWDVTGASNLEELHDTLRGTIMVRRTKDEVLDELPPKRRQVIELTSDKATKVIEAEREAWARHRSRLGQLKAAGRAEDGGGLGDKERENLRRETAEAFGELSKLRRATALAKVPLIVEHVAAALEESAKIVLFAHHRDVIAELADEFEGRCVTLTGEDSPESRQVAVDRFQEEPDCALFIGSITAAGFGLTLTAASHVVFAELDWVPANLTQAEDRTHRIGQKDSVLIQHLVLQGSLDAAMARTLIRKQEVVNQAVGGDREASLFDVDWDAEAAG